jgi:site-specific recombinase XerD
MISKTFQVSFFLRRAKAKKSIEIPIYAKITINGQTTIISTKQYVQEIYWDSSIGRVLPVDKKLKEINSQLDFLASQIGQAYSTLMIQGNFISVNSLRGLLFGEKNIGRTILEIAQEHNTEFEALVNKQYSYGSFKNYKTTLKYLKDFIKANYGRADIPLGEIDYAFGKAYYMYMLSEKPCNNNGAIKHIQRLKKLINYAIKMDYLEKNPLNRLSLSLDSYTRDILTMKDVKHLQSLKIEQPHLKTVRDVFIFQCYTGLSYSDLKNLTKSNLTTGEDGNLWMVIYRQKTNTRSPVPLLPKAVEILNMYLIAREHDKIFPVLSNQKMNSSLKKIAELADLKINLSTHVGRHTFATTITLSNNIPIETVSKMLGHTNLRTTQIYAKVIDTKIGNDMKVLMQKLKKQ